MKISELIVELESVKKECGDIDVVCADDQSPRDPSTRDEDGKVYINSYGELLL